jgi:hypothetical protein
MTQYKKERFLIKQEISLLSLYQKLIILHHQDYG